MADVAWHLTPGLTGYAEAVTAMEQRVGAIRDGSRSELIWLVEHPPLYTAGTSATAADLRDPRLPIHASGRGGRYTYHGPGQRVVYVMLDLERRGRDLHRFVHGLEDWIVAALGRLGVAAFTVPARPGVWVKQAAGPEAKIAAIGVRVRRWVTFHGFAINVAPDLADFDGIVPCGLNQPVISLRGLGHRAEIVAVDAALAETCPVPLKAEISNPLIPLEASTLCR